MSEQEQEKKVVELHDEVGQPREYLVKNLLYNTPSLPWKFKLLKSKASTIAEKTRKRYNDRVDWELPLRNELVSGFKFSPISNMDSSEMRLEEAIDIVMEEFLKYFNIDVTKPPAQQAIE